MVLPYYQPQMPEKEVKVDKEERPSKKRRTLQDKPVAVEEKKKSGENIGILIGRKRRERKASKRHP